MFRIGEFSQLARVSRRLLQFYDQQGLLTPAWTDPASGYRYYSARQLARLNRILALKELVFSLDDIAQMLHDDITDADIHAMLLAKRAEVERTIQDDVQRLRRIEVRLQQNQLSDDALDVVIKSIPASLFLAVRTVVPSPPALAHLLSLMQTVAPTRIESRSLGPLVGVVYTEEFRLHNNDIALGYLLTRPIRQTVPLSDQYELHMVELPAVATMASVVQVGGPDLIFAALGRIGRWIEVNEYCLAGPYRELGLQLPTDGGPDEMVIEVQMPLELRRGTPLPAADGHLMQPRLAEGQAKENIDAHADQESHHHRSASVRRLARHRPSVCRHRPVGELDTDVIRCA
jgi:DNA-binding transcriptional MerR regulator